MEKINAVILAGGSADGIEAGLRYKGMVHINGRPMIEYIVDAMRAAKTIDRIAVTIPTRDDLGSWAEKVDEIVITDGDFIDNSLRGVAAVEDDDKPLLLSTGDLPAITPEAIDDFVIRSLESGAAYTYPLIREETVQEQCPGSKRTFFKLAEGRFTGGNFVMVTPSCYRAGADVGRAVFELRKNPLQIARYASPRFMVKLAAGHLTIPEAEKKASKAFKGRLVAIISDYAVIGADVDKPADVEIVSKAIEEHDLLNV